MRLIKIVIKLIALVRFELKNINGFDILIDKDNQMTFVMTGIKSDIYFVVCNNSRGFQGV